MRAKLEIWIRRQPYHVFRRKWSNHQSSHPMLHRSRSLRIRPARLGIVGTVGITLYLMMTSFLMLIVLSPSYLSICRPFSSPLFLPMPPTSRLALSDRHFSWQVYRQHIHASLNVLLARHIPPPHQLRTFRHDRIRHHRCNRHDRVTFRIVGRELALLRLALQNQIIPAVGRVAAISQLPTLCGPENRDERFGFGGRLGDELRDRAARVLCNV
jgi:hypothetical protein